MTSPQGEQCRTRRFPASSSSRERFARDGVVAMDDPRRRKRMSLQESIEAVPGEHPLTIPTGQLFLPDPHFSHCSQLTMAVKTAKTNST